MKRYNKIDKHSLLIGLVLPILCFFISMNVTYAYFTAQATDITIDKATSAIVRIVTEDTKISINTIEYSNQKIVPGDAVTLSGTLKNAGNIDVYVLIKLTVGVKKVNEASETLSSPIYYIVNNKSTVDNTGDDETIIKGADDNAFLLGAQKSVGYKISHIFDLETYNDDYQNGSASIYLNFYAIQADCLGDNPETTATQALMAKAAQ